MHKQRNIQNITLVGFMGTGKTTIGRSLQQRLGCDFIDTDQLIEERTKKTIAEIFEKEGEPVFRAYEMQIVESLSQIRRATIIATGGGLILNISNLYSLKNHSLVVCLWASSETIWERVHNQIHRPLLEKPGAKEKAKQINRIEELLEIRQSVYRQADILMDTGHLSVREVTRRILTRYRQAQPAE